MLLTGGCLCNAVAFEFSCDRDACVDYCHCHECRKASGAPVLAWVQVVPTDFRVTRGQAKAFASSLHATRWFCPDCGTPLFMTDDENRSVGITLGALDQPEALQPTVHGWVSERLAWFQSADALPCYPQAPPYDR